MTEGGEEGDGSIKRDVEKECKVESSNEPFEDLNWLVNNYSYDEVEALIKEIEVDSQMFEEVLNETSLWWFNKTQHITPNAVVSTPDKNVTIAKKCTVFPVEFVVRGFVSGSTDTSLWTVYSKGVRNYCGNVLPEGMVKNQKLPANILTPTTKETDHDVPVSPDEVKLLDLLASIPVVLGSLLSLTVIRTEVHTPDSSRYWIANSYEKRFNGGLEPENVDKEFLRLWFKDHCNPYEDEVLPEAPEELVCELAWRPAATGTD
ncbi:hypothetical protein COCNU_05G005290 [Cocos nucifera]|uniref:phosphoribosylaminoimidazolesuccinocarboxamide synthase n=1 Tax=Cocos nucifera TaxID=13894 RepID=A0A8K0I8D6_COCNU|nr:hypothetical protein COCNU_05G005290 [Cocos nucifera]